MSTNNRPDRDSIVRVETCCWRYSLRTGCIAIAIWSMIESTVMITGTFLLLQTISSAPICTPDQKRSDLEGSEVYTLIFCRDEHTKTQFNLLVIALSIVSTYLCLSSILLVGTVKRKYKLMYPWLLWTLLEIFLAVFTFSFIERGFSILLKIYFSAVIYNYIGKLKEEAVNGGGRNNLNIPIYFPNNFSRNAANVVIIDAGQRTEDKNPPPYSAAMLDEEEPPSYEGAVALENSKVCPPPLYPENDTSAEVAPPPPGFTECEPPKDTTAGPGSTK